MLAKTEYRSQPTLLGAERASRPPGGASRARVDCLVSTYADGSATNSSAPRSGRDASPRLHKPASLGSEYAVEMNSCHAIRQDLAECVLNSDCVQKEGRSGQDCLQSGVKDLPMECQNIYRSYVACRKGLLDMRKRFRGNAPTPAKSNNAPGGTTTVESNLSDPSSTS
ncbi:unnamed protein product [Parajaminaea phylloscopi]